MHTIRLRDIEILDTQFTGMHRQCKPLGDKSNNLETIRVVGIGGFWMLGGTTPVPSLKKGGELYGYGCTARRNVRHGLLSLSAGCQGTAPLLFARRGRGWFSQSIEHPTSLTALCVNLFPEKTIQSYGRKARKIRWGGYLCMKGKVGHDKPISVLTSFGTIPRAATGKTPHPQVNH
jgi:hypothetical protein